MTIGKRIREAREAADLTLDAVARACGGKTPQAVYRWEAGKAQPYASDLATVAALTGVSLAWLITGHGDAQIHKIARTDRGVGRPVPKVAWGDLPMYLIGNGDTGQHPIAETHYDCGPRSFSTVVDDDSNEPEFYLGDTVVIDPDAKPKPGDLVLALTPKSGPLIRRYRQREDHVELAPINRDWPTTTIPALDETTLVGVVVEHSRRLR